MKKLLSCYDKNNCLSPPQAALLMLAIFFLHFSNSSSSTTSSARRSNLGSLGGHDGDLMRAPKREREREREEVEEADALFRRRNGSLVLERKRERGAPTRSDRRGGQKPKPAAT